MQVFVLSTGYIKPSPIVPRSIQKYEHERGRMRAQRPIFSSEVDQLNERSTYIALYPDCISSAEPSDLNP